MNRRGQGVTDEKNMDDHPFRVRFRARPSDDAEEHAGPPSEDPARTVVYRQALAFTARALEITELACAERFHLRDQLDRKASLVPQLIAQGLATADMFARRALYVRAREVVTDCAALLDIVAERGIIGPDQLAPAAALAAALLDTLAPLTVPPQRVR
jgi:hypothetical protein